MRRRLGHCRFRLQRDRRLEHCRHESSGDGEGCASRGLYARESGEVPSHSLDDPIRWAEAWPDPQTGTTIPTIPYSLPPLIRCRSGSLGHILMLAEVMNGTNWQISPSIGWR